MSERALILKPTSIQTVDDEIQALIADEAANESHAFELKPPRFGIVSSMQLFASKLTGDTYRTLEGVIISSREARGFWEEGSKAPICSSVDGINGTARESTTSRRCGICPKNTWGSDPKGGRGKACKDMRRLIIHLEQSPIPIIFSIPPTSVGTFDEYCSGLMLTKPQRYYFAVVTKFALDKATNPDGQDYSKLKLEKVRDLTIEELRHVKGLRDEFQRYVSTEIEAEDYDISGGNGNGYQGHDSPPPDTYDDDPGPVEEPREAYTTKQNGMDF